MANTFTVLINSIPISYDNLDDIPESFDYLVEFLPEIPPGPHTDDEHESINMWPSIMQELLTRETRPHSSKREIKKPRPR